MYTSLAQRTRGTCAQLAALLLLLLLLCYTQPARISHCTTGSVLLLLAVSGLLLEYQEGDVIYLLAVTTKSWIA
jgi:hypothetical protein